MDEGLPIAYPVLEPGVPVYDREGTQVGTVDHVVAAPEEDIFHGVVMQAASGPRFVAADQISALHEHGVDLSIDGATAAALPRPHGAAPDLRVRDPTAKTHRWKEILDMVKGKGSINPDWSDEE